MVAPKSGVTDIQTSSLDAGRKHISWISMLNESLKATISCDLMVHTVVCQTQHDTETVHCLYLASQIER